MRPLISSLIKYYIDSNLEKRVEKIESQLLKNESAIKSEKLLSDCKTIPFVWQYMRSIESRIETIERKLSIPTKFTRYGSIGEHKSLWDLRNFVEELNFRVEETERKLSENGSPSKKKVTKIPRNKTDSVTISGITASCRVENSKVFQQNQMEKKCEKSIPPMNSSSGNCLSPNLLKDLSDDFNSMFIKGIFTDVNIKCGSEVLKAHKNILCARSSVFEAMFSTPMLESVMDSVVIDDIESGILRTMLTFMYSGQVKDLNTSIACDLLYAAEKYQIKGLKQVCVQYLKSHISVENAFHILRRGDLYDKLLKATVLTFISQHFSILKGTDEWQDLQLSEPPLALEVYACVVEMLQKEK